MHALSDRPSVRQGEHVDILKRDRSIQNFWFFRGLHRRTPGQNNGQQNCRSPFYGKFYSFASHGYHPSLQCLQIRWAHPLRVIKRDGVHQGSEVITADWVVAKPLFSAISMSCIRAYVVKGTAPDMISTNPTNMNIGQAFRGLTLASNVSKTDFYTGSSSMGSGSGMGS